MTRSFRFKASSIPIPDGASESIIDLARVGTHDNRFTWTVQKFQKLVDNFHANAYRKNGRDGAPILPVNYAHDDRSGAAGWITDVFTENDGTLLRAKVLWTPKGAQAVRDMEYLHASAEWIPGYVDPETKKKWGDTLTGAGLVLDPAVKDLAALTAKNQNKGNNMAKHEQAAVADMTIDDVLAWIKTASMEDQMKISELVDTMVPDAPSDSMPPAAPGMAEVKPAEQKASSELERLQGTVKDLESKLELASRESAFNKLLATGQAVEAQREAFLKNDMVAFASAFVPGLNMSAHGVKSNATQVVNFASKLSPEDKKAAELAKVSLEEYARLNNLI